MDLRQASALAKALERVGFLALGGFHPGPRDACPPAADGRPGATLLLIGNAGPALWQAFRAAAEADDGDPDPLDRYTRRTLGTIAARFALAAVYPFERPYPPFQRWALAAGGFSPSPMGALAHHRYGPWAGFRAAFVSAERFGTFEGNGTPGPCPACVERPCIAACPAGALSSAGYDVPRCLAHLEKNPQADCLAGCLARRACPWGTGFRPGRDQARFHMAAFTGWRDGA